jgi:Ca-activated chloride channel family protein
VKKGQLAIVALAIVAVAAIALLGGRKDSGTTSGTATSGGGSAAPAGAVKVTFAYSPEKEGLLKPLVAEFNRSRATVGGKRVFVEAQNVASGDAEARIAAGRFKPVAWTPSSSLWGRLLDFEADRDLAPATSPSIVRTPLVIAMWEPMAQALGYPRKKIGFADILKLARSGQGWAAYGRPEFGRFKLVHTNPDYSTSGLSAVVAEYYAATGKQEGLLPSDVTGKARATVRAIERSIVHYGDTTLFISDQMRREGPGYASAVAMEEATLVAFNANRGSQPKLVAVYPAEGTFYSDNPFIVLAGDWVTSAQKQGAQAFQRFLAEKVTPEVASKAGFRPADLKAAPVAPLDAAHGVDPRQPTRVLGLPEPRVLAQLKAAWRGDRKPANVLLVLDTSGSMSEEGRLDNAKRGLEAFISQLQPQDRVGLTIFSDRIQPLVGVGPLPENKAKLRATVGRLIAGGGTAIYDATANAFETVTRLAARNDRINAVVVLTDGEDTDSSRTADDVSRELAGQGDRETRVRVFTIAYSAGAAGAADALARIADASGGKAYTGNVDDIESVYRSISSFF